MDNRFFKLLYMVTDNDGVDDSTGETQFQHLGRRFRIFGL